MEFIPRKTPHLRLAPCLGGRCLSRVSVRSCRYVRQFLPVDDALPVLAQGPQPDLLLRLVSSGSPCRSGRAPGWRRRGSSPTPGRRYRCSAGSRRRSRSARASCCSAQSNPKKTGGGSVFDPKVMRRRSRTTLSHSWRLTSERTDLPSRAPIHVGDFPFGGDEKVIKSGLKCALNRVERWCLAVDRVVMRNPRLVQTADCALHAAAAAA